MKALLVVLSTKINDWAESDVLPSCHLRRGQIVYSDRTNGQAYGPLATLLKRTWPSSPDCSPLS